MKDLDRALAQTGRGGARQENPACRARCCHCCPLPGPGGGGATALTWHANRSPGSAPSVNSFPVFRTPKLAPASSCAAACCSPLFWDGDTHACVPGDQLPARTAVASQACITTATQCKKTMTLFRFPLPPGSLFFSGISHAAPSIYYIILEYWEVKKYPEEKLLSGGHCYFVAIACSSLGAVWYLINILSHPQ